jgi:uncharacterized protein (DUF433 family)
MSASFTPMADKNHSLLGMGVYTVPEAARLTGVPAPTIRRWVTGYTFTRNGIAHASPPLWESQIAPIDNAVALGFRDLLEVRFVQFFRAHGVGWRAIKLAAECASEIIKDSHPFSTKRFKTDGRSIFAEIAQATGEDSLLDLSKRQYELKSFVEPYLFQGLEFADMGIAAVRWWPLGKNRRVTVDPERAFGQPICSPESVPTAVLAQAYEAEQSVDAVARWFLVHPKSVSDAVEFENKLSSAA